MKIVKFLSIIFLMTIVLLGCSKSDDDDEENNSLVGTWKLTAEKVDGISQDLTSCELQNTLIFTATTIRTIEYMGENCSETFEMNGTYNSNNSTLNMSFDLGGTIIQKSVEIITLNATALVTKDVDAEDGEITIDTFARQ